MDKRILRLVAVMVGLLLLGSIANSIYHSGWSQGYFMGILASGEGGGELMAPYFMYGRHGFLGGFFGALFRFGFFALLFVALFKGLRYLKRGRHNGWGGPSWGQRWYDEPQEGAEPEHRHDDDDAPHSGDTPSGDTPSGGTPSGPTPTGRVYWA